MEYFSNYFDKLESTQTTAIELISMNSLKVPILIMADEQTAGYGTNNRSWNSMKGNLLATFCILEEECKLKQKFPETELSVGCAKILKNAVQKTTGINLNIKEPNDLTYEGKKCSGILISKIEDITGKSVLCIGIGFNAQHAPKTNQATIAIPCDKNALMKEFIQLLLE
jgi:BirA family biotin operon repressor/biotin-[acetyl-CoA-carboxylase] ligase